MPSHQQHLPDKRPSRIPRRVAPAVVAHVRRAPSRERSGRVLRPRVDLRRRSHPPYGCVRTCRTGCVTAVICCRTLQQRYEGVKHNRMDEGGGALVSSVAGLFGVPLFLPLLYQVVDQEYQAAVVVRRHHAAEGGCVALGYRGVPEGSRGSARNGTAHTGDVLRKAFASSSMIRVKGAPWA